MVEAMARLQEDKARLQEELAALQERLALRDGDQQAASAQLQNQVPGEEGTGRGPCPPWGRSENMAPVTRSPPGRRPDGQLAAPLRAPSNPSGQRSLLRSPHGTPAGKGRVVWMQVEEGALTAGGQGEPGFRL